METTSITYIFIIVLVCGFVILLFMSSNLLNVIQAPGMLPDTNIKITGEAEITPSGTGPYFYSISLPLKIEHQGKWEYGASVDIIPLITFKGIDTRPYIGSTFSLSEGESIDMELGAIIKSDIGLVQKQGAYYDGQMSEYESFLMTTDDGNFLVTIEDIHDIPAKVKFSVECETDKQTIELVDWNLCQEGSKRYPEQYEYCERYLSMCDGEIHIALVGPTRMSMSGIKYTDQVIIDAEGGKPFQPAEFVEISLWRTGCTNDYDNFYELRSDCMDYFLGYASIQEAESST